MPVTHAIAGIDLADNKQMVVVTDHDSKVLARKTFRCRAWDLGAALDWAAERAAAKGFAGLTVACEPTGHRWRVLGQTGDPRRFATARALVKHAGLAPREKLSRAFTGKTRLTGQGRPGLRLAAWRAVWGAQRANPVYGARYRHLTSREQNKLRPTQAQTVVAAAILRHLHAVITTGQAWDPTIATNGTRPAMPTPEPSVADQAGGRGEPYAALRHP